MTLVRLAARHPATDREPTQRAHALLLSSAVPPETLDIQNDDISAVVARTLEELAALALADQAVGAQGNGEISAPT